MMSARTLITVPLTHTRRPLHEQVHTAVTLGADAVELRVDQIGDVAAVKNLLRAPRVLPVIATVRSPAEGGAWKGAESARQALIVELADLRPEYIDVELATWNASPDLRASLKQLCQCAGGRPGANSDLPQLILSQHNFEDTPDNLDAVFARFTDTPADVVKLAFMASDACDGLRVLDHLAKWAQQRPTIGLAMGAEGVAARILAAKAGGTLTFAAQDADSASAPGQVPLSDFIDTFNARKTQSTTRVFGVVGWPVEHSQSPRIHNLAMAAEGIDGIYVPFPVRPTYADFASFIHFVDTHPALDVGGLSITLPHKEHALRWVRDQGGDITDLADRCGAANTLTRTADGHWLADNTDIRGALEALQAALPKDMVSLRDRRAAVLGAGGVARAVVIGLRDVGVTTTLYNRTATRARSLADELGCAWQPWEQRTSRDADILINCTSVGLWPDVDATPMPVEALGASAVVMDTIYRPRMTRMLRDASELGCRIVTGDEMFVRQGAAQFARWHQCTPPVEKMRKALVGIDDAG